MGAVTRNAARRAPLALRVERDAASRADTCPVPSHANRDFRDIGNERVAEPHDVGRTGLLLLRSALRGGRRRHETNGADQGEDGGAGCQPE